MPKEVFLWCANVVHFFNMPCVLSFMYKEMKFQFPIRCRRIKVLPLRVETSRCSVCACHSSFFLSQFVQSATGIEIRYSTLFHPIPLKHDSRRSTLFLLTCLNRSKTPWKKVRKLLCRSMASSGSKAISPKTWGRKRGYSQREVKTWIWRMICWGHRNGNVIVEQEEELKNDMPRKWNNRYNVMSLITCLLLDRYLTM